MKKIFKTLKASFLFVIFPKYPFTLNCVHQQSHPLFNYWSFLCNSVEGIWCFIESFFVHTCRPFVGKLWFHVGGSIFSFTSLNSFTFSFSSLNGPLLFHSQTLTLSFEPSILKFETIFFIIFHWQDRTVGVTIFVISISHGADTMFLLTLVGRTRIAN